MPAACWPAGRHWGLVILLHPQLCYRCSAGSSMELFLEVLLPQVKMGSLLSSKNTSTLWKQSKKKTWQKCPRSYFLRMAYSLSPGPHEFPTKIMFSDIGHGTCLSAHFQFGHLELVLSSVLSSVFPHCCPLSSRPHWGWCWNSLCPEVAAWGYETISGGHARQLLSLLS